MMLRRIAQENQPGDDNDKGTGNKKDLGRLAARVGGDYRAVPDLPPAPEAWADALLRIARWSRDDADVPFMLSLAAAFAGEALHAHAASYYHAGVTRLAPYTCLRPCGICGEIGALQALPAPASDLGSPSEMPSNPSAGSASMGRRRAVADAPVRPRPPCPGIRCDAALTHRARENSVLPLYSTRAVGRLSTSFAIQ